MSRIVALALLALPLLLCMCEAHVERHQAALVSTLKGMFRDGGSGMASNDDSGSAASAPACLEVFRSAITSADIEDVLCDSVGEEVFVSSFSKQFGDDPFEGCDRSDERTLRNLFKAICPDAANIHRVDWENDLVEICTLYASESIGKGLSLDAFCRDSRAVFDDIASDVIKRSQIFRGDLRCVIKAYRSAVEAKMKDHLCHGREHERGGDSAPDSSVDVPAPDSSVDVPAPASSVNAVRVLRPPEECRTAFEAAVTLDESVKLCTDGDDDDDVERIGRSAVARGAMKAACLDDETLRETWLEQWYKDTCLNPSTPLCPQLIKKYLNDNGVDSDKLCTSSPGAFVHELTRHDPEQNVFGGMKACKGSEDVLRQSVVDVFANECGHPELKDKAFLCEGVSRSVIKSVSMNARTKRPNFDGVFEEFGETICAKKECGGEGVCVAGISLAHAHWMAHQMRKTCVDNIYQELKRKADRYKRQMTADEMVNTLSHKLRDGEFESEHCVLRALAESSAVDIVNRLWGNDKKAPAGASSEPKFSLKQFFKSNLYPESGKDDVIQVFRFASWDREANTLLRDTNAGDLRHVCAWGNPTTHGPVGRNEGIASYIVQVPSEFEGYSKCNKGECYGLSVGHRQKEFGEGICEPVVDWFSFPETGLELGQWKILKMNRLVSYECLRNTGIFSLKDPYAFWRRLGHLMSPDGRDECPDMISVE